MVIRWLLEQIILNYKNNIVPFSKTPDMGKEEGRFRGRRLAYHFSIYYLWGVMIDDIFNPNNEEDIRRELKQMDLLDRIERIVHLESILGYKKSCKKIPNIDHKKLDEEIKRLARELVLYKSSFKD